MELRTAERAKQVNEGNNKSEQTTVGVGNEADSLEGFTTRLLMSLVFDVSQLADNVERVKVLVFTAAKAHGIVPPTVPVD